MEKTVETDEAHAHLAANLVAYGLRRSASDILMERRGTADAALARQIAMYIVYVGCGMSLARVAAAFGRDRSTVAHACHQIEDRRDNPAFDAWLESLEATLRQAGDLCPADWRAA